MKIHLNELPAAHHHLEKSYARHLLKKYSFTHGNLKDGLFALKWGRAGFLQALALSRISHIAKDTCKQPDDGMSPLQFPRLALALPVGADQERCTPACGRLVCSQLQEVQRRGESHDAPNPFQVPEHFLESAEVDCITHLSVNSSASVSVVCKHCGINKCFISLSSVL